MNRADRIKAAVMRLGIHTVGRLSDGLRLCLDEGLTAGKTVDYVYRNQPSGRLWIGKVIDRAYLNHPDWAAVRARRVNLEAEVEAAIADLAQEGRELTLVDIASGPASYMLAVASKPGLPPLRVICSDRDERWLAEGRAEAEKLGLTNVSFELGDAFDGDALIARHPDIVVASGFYDWIDDDAEVRSSFGQVAAALRQGGRFVLTNQVGHPDLEFVSAVFESHTHEPLRMKMRPVEQIASWLAESGMEVVDTRIDPRGYFAALHARRL